MISISALLLTIQICLFLLFPILRITILKFFFDDEKLKKFYLYSYIASSLIITISFVSYFLYSYFTTTIEPLSIFKFYESQQYNIEIGFRIDLIQVVFYATIFLALPLIINYLALSNPKLEIKHLERIILIFTISILLIFSPNFLQFLVIYLVLDVLIIDFVNFSIFSDRKQKNNIKSLVFSFILGNIFIFISIALLIRRSRSFDFSVIYNDIMFKFILSNPYFRNLCILLLIGIIIKCSLFPFHNWKSEVCKDNNEWLFLILNVYMLFSLFTLLGTPFIHIIYIIKNFLVWLGIAIALFSVVVAVFLNEGYDIGYLLQSAFIGLIFVSIGTGLYSAALHQVSLLPYVFSILLMLTSIQVKNDENKKLENTKSGISDLIIIFSTAILALLPLFGTIPLNSVLVTLTYSFYSTDLLAPIGILTGGLLTLVITFFICLTFFRRIWKKRNEMVLSSIHNFTYVYLVLILILTSAFFPTFFLQNSIAPIINEKARDYLISAIPLLVSCLIILLLYFIGTKYLEDLNKKLVNFFTPARKTIRTMYYFDFIFYASSWIWSNTIKPLSVWTYNIIIFGFLYQIITKNVLRFISKIISIISISLTEYVGPLIKKIFVNTSKFFLKLEQASLRRQVQLAVFFIFAILLTFVLYYVGGSI